MEWTKITQDNVDKVYKYFTDGYPVIIANRHKKYDDTFNVVEEITTYQMNHTISFRTMAKLGGYYYIVLPKLY